MLMLRILSRRYLLPLMLYCVAGMAVSYFVWHAVHGQRGLRIGEEFEQKLTQLRFERDILKIQRQEWEKRIGLIKGETIDADILDEEVRRSLGRVHKNEVVILIPADEPKK
jgi:cell division protein FtsB